MNIAIFGGNGFIGKNLIEKFNKKDNFIEAIDKDEINLKNIPIKEGEFHTSGIETSVSDLVNYNMRYLPFDISVNTIIQAAATTSGAKDIVNKPYYHVTDNILMNTKILQSLYDLASSKSNKKFNFVFFSCTVMYPQDLERAITEYDFTGEIADQYFGVGWAKVYIEKLMEFYSRLLPNVTFTVIRHSNIYGPHDKFDLEKSHLFGATLNKVLTTPNGGEIEVWGDGTTVRDLLYVDDLMDFVETVIGSQINNFEIYNVGSGIPISVNELARTIIDVSRKNLTIKYNTDKPSFKNGLWLDYSKAKKDLAWYGPKVNLEEGIEKTINWLHNRVVEL